MTRDLFLHALAVVLIIQVALVAHSAVDALRAASHDAESAQCAANASAADHAEGR